MSGSQILVPTRIILTPAHQKVVDEYFANGCLSKKRAMLAAGYAQATPSALVFGRSDVMRAIETRYRRHREKVEVTEDRIIEELANIAFANLGDLLDVQEDGTALVDMGAITPEIRAALSEYSVETYPEKQLDEDGKPCVVEVKKSRVKFHSKQAALESLARIKGMNRDKVEVSGTNDLMDRVAQARLLLSEPAPGDSPLRARDGG